MEVQNSFLFIFSIIVVLLSDTIGASETYTRKERVALQKFREQMGSALYKGYMKSDPYLIRWLRATNFDAEQAAERLKTTLNWRKDNKIDTILKENILRIERPFYYPAGLDKNGGLVTVVGLIDMREHLDTAGRYWLQILESLEIRTLASLGVLGNSSTESAITKGTVIGDASGFNLRQHACVACMPIMIQMMRDYVVHYPGYVRTLLILNASDVLEPVSEVMKPILENQLDDGIKYLGAVKDEWMKRLHRLVKPVNLGRHLGGTRVVTIQQERQNLRNLFRISQGNTKQ